MNREHGDMAYCLRSKMDRVGTILGIFLLGIVFASCAPPNAIEEPNQQEEQTNENTGTNEKRLFLSVIGISPNGNFARVDFDATTGEVLLAEEKIEYNDDTVEWKSFLEQ